MNIVIVVALYAVGAVASAIEIFNKKTNYFLLIIQVALFVLCIDSRIGHSYSYSDFSTYLRFFQEGNDAYFEKGYVFYCGILKCLFGQDIHMFCLITSLIIIGAALIAVDIMYSNQNCENIKIVVNQRKIWAVPALMYSGTFLFTFTSYWGIVFAGEALRQGIACALLLVALALALNGKKLLPCIVLIIASGFHTSAILFMLALLVIFLVKKYPSKSQYFFWLCALIVVDIIVNLTSALNISVILQLLQNYVAIPAVAKLFNYENATVGNYFSTQYLTYHILALVMVCVEHNCEEIKKCIYIYYIGLTLGTIFSKTAILMRIQWVFLPVSIIAIYYFIKTSLKTSSKIKYMLVTIFSLLQTVMSVRYLGMYF